MVAVLLIATILYIVLYFVVVVKMFKNDNLALGIISIPGFFIPLLNLFPFIWGWVKHKEWGTTKLMTVWTVTLLLPFVVVPIMGVSSAIMIPQYLQEMSGSSDFKFSDLKSSDKTSKKQSARKNKKLKSTQKLPRQNVDWSQKALALWQGDKYKDPNEAVDYWNRAINSRQNTAIAYSNRGLAYHELKQYQRAVKDYNAAIKRDPDYAAAYNNRGNSYYELAEYQLALNDFNKSLKLKPQYAKAHLNRGLVFYQMDKEVQACQDFQNSCDQGDCDGIKWAMKNGICK